METDNCTAQLAAALILISSPRGGVDSPGRGHTHEGGLSGTKSVSLRLAATANAPQPQPLQQELEGLQTRVGLGDTGTEAVKFDKINPGDLALDDDHEGHSSGRGSMGRDHLQITMEVDDGDRLLPDVPPKKDRKRSNTKQRENGRNVTSFRAWPLWPAAWVGYELGGSAPHQCR